MISVKNIIKSL